MGVNTDGRWLEPLLLVFEVQPIRRTCSPASSSTLQLSLPSLDAEVEIWLPALDIPELWPPKEGMGKPEFREYIPFPKDEVRNSSPRAYSPASEIPGFKHPSRPLKFRGSLLPGPAIYLGLLQSRVSQRTGFGWLTWMRRKSGCS
jgi:hypothetical protein